MVVATPMLLARAVQLLKTRSAQTAVSIEEGDLTRLLPRLRVGELDLIVGRLEPGYAAPDSRRRPFRRPMSIVARPDHALARKARLAGTILRPCLGGAAALGFFTRQAQSALLPAQAQPASGPDRVGVVPRHAHVHAAAPRGGIRRALGGRYLEAEGLAKVLNIKVRSSCRRSASS